MEATMRIGTMFLGKVDSLGGESIQTKFLIIGIPLLPLGSIYVTSEAGGLRGYDIGVHPKSALFGYLRIYAWIGAVVTGVYCFAERHPPAAAVIGTFLLGVVAVVSTFFLGKLAPPELRRRQALREVAGLGAPPELLPPALLEDLRGAVLRDWERSTKTPWREAITRGDNDARLVALAEYHQEPALAALVLSRRG